MSANFLLCVFFFLHIRTVRNIRINNQCLPDSSNINDRAFNHVVVGSIPTDVAN